MITQCSNCAGPLVFDPGKQRLVCDHCGSMFRPEEVGVSPDDPTRKVEAESMNRVLGTDSDEYMDCYVYTCASCGGEVMINGTEASTKCIYCGNSSVVFSRIDKHKRPEFILPFKVPKEDAIAVIRERFKKGIFIPREVKNFNADNVRGIYIPYWIVDCSHSGSVMIEAKVKQGKNTVTRYYGRSGKMKLESLPIDGSRTLSDDSSSRLEPYDLRRLVDFDEDYLLGFYSNVSDITYLDLNDAVKKRAKEYFEEQALNDVKEGSNKKIVEAIHETNIFYNQMNYAMLPAWFITYDYKGKHNTILVNGQTGKIVCGVPWNKILFYTLLILAGVVFTVATFFLMRPLIESMLRSGRSSSSSKGDGKVLAVIITGAIAMFTVGIKKIVKTVKSIELTQAKSIFNFVKKRQE